MHIYLFNPENDLALANFTPHYTAPASALTMRSNLALLPIWYCAQNSNVLINQPEAHSYLHHLQEQFHLPCFALSTQQLASLPIHTVHPWGWSPAIKRELQLDGVPEHVLPTNEQLHTIRSYSNRKNAVTILSALTRSHSDYCGSSLYFDDISLLLHYIASHPANYVLKMPLSGSGKGLVWMRDCTLTDKQVDWCRRVVKLQGGVVVEPILHKAIDFAMEFEIDNHHKLSFIGYSLFQSASSGAYEGNLLLPDHAIEEKLGHYISIDLLHATQARVAAELKKHFPLYRGTLGVDMMVCQTSPTEYQLHPCVEINMRMNMGIVAHRFYRRHLGEQSQGLFAIRYFGQRGEAHLFAQAMQRSHPLHTAQHKLLHGFLPLTPTTPTTKYLAYALVREDQ